MTDFRKLESFAAGARQVLINQISARIMVVLAPGSTDRIENPQAVSALEKSIRAHGGDKSGRAHVAEEQAYSWFNRIVALRFMDANGYTHSPVVSPASGLVGQPACLAAAKRGEYDRQIFANRTTQDRIAGLLNGSLPSYDPQGEAYGLIFRACCRFWNTAMPFMFQPEGSYSELLMPTDLLADTSIRAQAVELMTPEDCRDVEIIGWLYQYYISARKDEVFAGFTKGKKAGPDEIPAATQLFTPDWIVRYLVQNSVGRLWMLNHPESKLIEQMEYYIAPVGEPGEFLKINKPEELTVMDPACGSGHMLTYASDLLYAIYEEEGYAPSEIPGLILTHNLFGCEIDQRAGVLASFALTMKALAKQRRFFDRKISPNICVLENFPGTEFAHADLFGSLIRPGETDLLNWKAALVATGNSQAAHDSAPDLFTESEAQLAQQVEYLSQTYNVVVTNPPYMGGKNMDATLATFAKDNYPTTKSDLFAMFIERCMSLASAGGQLGFMTPFVWMFIKTYEPLRQSLLKHETITSLIQLEYSGFDGATVPICTFTLQHGSVSGYEGGFVRLADFVGPRLQAPKALEAIQDQTTNWFYRSRATDFTAIPGTPIVYWLSEKMRAAFAKGQPLGHVAEPREGLTSTDNNRFKRAWWEVGLNVTCLNAQSASDASASEAAWFPVNNGGGFRRWYGNAEAVINWHNNGDELKRFIEDKFQVSYSKQIRGERWYFLPSVALGKISSAAPSFREYPSGFVADSASKFLCIDGDDALAELAGFCNSPIATVLLTATAPTLNFTGGALGALPYIAPSRAVPLVIELTNWARSDWDSFEMSWNFEANDTLAVFRSMTG